MMNQIQRNVGVASESEIERKEAATPLDELVGLVDSYLYYDKRGSMDVRIIAYMISGREDTIDSYPVIVEKRTSA